MPIKYLVINGGGPTGLLTYGAARHLAKTNFWKLSNIQGIYGCSIGALVGVILSLDYDWEWLDDYFIKRPWEKLVSTTSSFNLINIYEQKGLLNEQFFLETISPLLKAKDLPVQITLEELYAYNHIDLHLYTTNINSDRLDKVDLSHKTHPNLTLIKALQMSMAFPIMIQPVCNGEGCYIDGGLLNNYPLNDCLLQNKCEKDEILAFKNIWSDQKYNIHENSNIVDFLMVIIKKMQMYIDTEDQQEEVKNTVRCLVEDLEDFSKWSEALSDETMRAKLIEKGQKQAELFLAYIHKP
jgi:predicted acylesterase/phospholipase RssA